MLKKLLVVSALCISTVCFNAYKTASAFSLGDLNGDGLRDSSDASLILQNYSMLSTNGDSIFNDEQSLLSDLNGDGMSDANDASLLLAFYSYVSTGGTESIENYLEPFKVSVSTTTTISTTTIPETTTTVHIESTTEASTYNPDEKVIVFILNTDTNCVHTHEECRAAKKILPENHSYVYLSEDKMNNGEYQKVYWACGICAKDYSDALPKF